MLTTATAEIPTSFAVGDRTYELVIFHKEGEDYVSGDVMMARATELKTEFGEEDARHILERQNEIPASFRGQIAMVFPKWHNGPRNIACLKWGSEWYQYWGWLGLGWGESHRLVRRVK